MLLLFVFAAAIMDAAVWLLLSDPVELLKRSDRLRRAARDDMTTAPLFPRLRIDPTLTAALCAGHRNMGVLVAAMGATTLPTRPSPTSPWRSPSSIWRRSSSRVARRLKG